MYFLPNTSSLTKSLSLQYVCSVEQSLGGTVFLLPHGVVCVNRYLIKHKFQSLHVKLKYIKTVYYMPVVCAVLCWLCSVMVDC